MSEIKLRKAQFYKDAKDNRYVWDAVEAWTDSPFHPLPSSKVVCKVCGEQTPRMLMQFYTKPLVFFCGEHLPENLEKWYRRGP
jgi:hypothetical protein